MPKHVNTFDTAIHVRIKHMKTTYFILCSEYETVYTLKGRVLDLMQQTGLKMPLKKGEEDYV